jgi:hypothetical protein
MNKQMIAAIIAASLSLAAQAQQSLHAATVTLDGDWYLQAGTVLNQSGAGILVTGLTYAMGTPQDGGGVWEDFLSEGRHESRLPGSSTHYSTQVWSGLQLQSQGVWDFGGLDLDRIVHTATGEVDSQNVDFSGVSLRNAYVEVCFSDGFRGQARLAALAWDKTQVLYIGDAVTPGAASVPVPVPVPVPEPAQGWLLAAGLGWMGLRRRKAG